MAKRVIAFRRGPWETARREMADQGNLSVQINELPRRTLHQADRVPWGDREAVLKWIDREIGKLQAIRQIYQE